MGSSPCHAENGTTVKVSAHAEVCPFSQSMAYKILSKDRVETNKDVKRERERDGEREREREREMGKVGREGGRERGRGGAG